MKKFALRRVEARRLGLHGLPEENRSWLQKEIEKHATHVIDKHVEAKKAMIETINKIRQTRLPIGHAEKNNVAIKKIVAITSTNDSRPLKYVEKRLSAIVGWQFHDSVALLFKRLAGQAMEAISTRPKTREALLERAMVNTLNNFYTKIRGRRVLNDQKPLSPSDIELQDKILKAALLKRVPIASWIQTLDEHNQNLVASLSREPHDHAKILRQKQYARHMLKLWPVFVKVLETTSEPESLRI